MAAAFPGGPIPNTFVPTFAASGKLQVEFSRDPKKFRLADYVSYTSVTDPSGYWLKITPELATRLVHDDTSDLDWPDSAVAPTGETGREQFEFVQYFTRRKASAWNFGYKTVDHSDWDIEGSHNRIHAQRLMSARTLDVITLLETSGNYASGHTGTATSLGGGTWNSGTSANPVIKKTLLNAFFQIEKATQNAVTTDDMVLVINPEAAEEMSTSREVHEYLAQSPHALAQVRGDKESQNGHYGLPDTMYGFKIAIENAVRTTSRVGASSTAREYIKAKANAAFIARPGGLDSESAGQSFSFAHVFLLEDLTVEVKDDPDNRRYMGRVVDDRDQKVVAPVSGYLITGLF